MRSLLLALASLLNRGLLKRMELRGILLGVNIDHSATLRQARFRGMERCRGQMVEPDPVIVAMEAQLAGADGITMHLREDRRHIQDEDVYRMQEMIQLPLNLEMAATEEMTNIAKEVKPEEVCIVPENREEVTTEGGLDVQSNYTRIREVVTELANANIMTSLFIDPDLDQIDSAAKSGAKYIELHTGAYANAYYGDGCKDELEKLKEAAQYANQLGLKVNGGHGLNYTNVQRIGVIPGLRMLNIGHSIMSRGALHWFSWKLCAR